VTVNKLTTNLMKMIFTRFIYINIIHTSYKNEIKRTVNALDKI